MQNKGIVIFLEGSEQCGKTTLAQKICDEFKAEYLHGSRPRTGDFWEYHYNKLQYAASAAAEGHVVVVDRCFISHLVYGNLFDGGPQYDIYKLHGLFCTLCDDENIDHITIYCRPEREFNPELREEAYSDEDGKITEEFDKVIEEYKQSRIGIEDVFLYDWTKEPTGESVLELIKRRLNNDKTSN